MELVVHNGQLRTNSCENGRLVTSQVNHLISDNLLFQFLCCEHQLAGWAREDGRSGLCLPTICKIERSSILQSYSLGIAQF